MKKIFFSAVLLLVFPVYGFASRAGGVLEMLNAKGFVNTKEIGGSGLCVSSLWDSRRAEPVAADGSFSTVISSMRPQKISVTDDRKMTRGLAIVFPEKRETVVFDAESTAMALLFNDPSRFVNAKDAGDFCRRVVSLKSFQNLVLFFRNNLSDKSLEDLNSSKECATLLEKCNGEVTGRSPDEIRDSLNAAQKELKKLLKDNNEEKKEN
ncbi:MAG: hypothetical protein PHN57_08920 [Candidatus Omnitrophica bacterium]|nr:hypothetical protein [Candidatus Omnitrophota bacterium]